MKRNIADIVLIFVLAAASLSLAAILMGGAFMIIKAAFTG